MKSTILALSALLLGCNVDSFGTAPPNNQPDAQATIKSGNKSPSMTAAFTDTRTTSDTTTATNTATKTETNTDAGIPDSTTVTQDILPATQDTLPQATPDVQAMQQPDALPMVDTKPATPDTLVLVDTKSATPDVLPIIDTKPAEDGKPATPDTQPAGGDTVLACGGDNQACCTTQAVDMPAGYWIHTCTDSAKGTYDCNIPTSTGAGPSGACLPCGYKGYPACYHLNPGMFSWKWMDTPGGTCDHDHDQTPVCTGSICLCP